MIKKVKSILKQKFPFFYRSYLMQGVKKKQIQEFETDLANFKASAVLTQKRFEEGYEVYPILDEKTTITPIEPHYTYHPAWAARILAQNKPPKHVDISSTLNFCTLVSAFIPIDFYDYRPAQIILEGLKSAHADLTKLHFADNSIESLSCMHTLEHVGLGRYGDPIDYDGDLKAIEELKRVLAINGDLLVVVPTGKPKIAYNAHRIYSYEQVISYFEPLQLVEFSLVPDNFENIGFIKNATKKQADEQHWGCGCFWFKKIQL